MSHTVNYSLVTVPAGLTYVRTDWRLQSRGGDIHLFANTGFGPADERDSEVLRQLVSILSLNNGGVDHITVKPFELTIWDSVLTSDELVERFETACRRAGKQPVRRPVRN